MQTPTSVSPTCEKSLRLLGDFWILRIIEALKDGRLRFCEIQRSVGNVNPATLTKKLQTLEQEGLVEREEEAEHVAVRYRLTDLGKKALPVVSAIDAFSKDLR